MGDRRTLMKYMILYVFEGYLFEIAVIKNSGSSLRSIEVQPHFTQKVNNRAYYHHLEVLKIEVREGKHDDKLLELIESNLVEPSIDVEITIAKITIFVAAMIFVVIYYA